MRQKARNGTVTPTRLCRRNGLRSLPGPPVFLLLLGGPGLGAMVMLPTENTGELPVWLGAAAELRSGAALPLAPFSDGEESR